MAVSEEQQEETKVSLGLFFRNLGETASAAREMRDENMAAYEVRKAKRFANSRLGRWWIPIRTEMQKTRRGRGWLAALRVISGILLISLSVGARPGINWIFDHVLYPPDYNLTNAQVAEGYQQTWSGNGRYSSQEEVAYRGFKDSEYASQPDCKMSFDYCVFAIPLYKDCPEIYMEFSTSATADSGAPAIEHLTSAVRPKLGGSFKPGEIVVLGVHAKSSKSQYGGVDHIYCRGLN